MFPLSTILVQHSHRGAALLHDGAQITPFRGNLKVGTDFALSFLRDTAKIIADFVTTTTMTNPGS